MTRVSAACSHQGYLSGQVLYTIVFSHEDANADYRMITRSKCSRLHPLQPVDAIRTIPEFMEGGRQVQQVNSIPCLGRLRLEGRIRLRPDTWSHAPTDDSRERYWGRDESWRSGNSAALEAEKQNHAWMYYKPYGLVDNLGEIIDAVLLPVEK